jgi:ubiquinone/menaquinone biosynthesis C-methylase UbiE
VNNGWDDSAAAWIADMGERGDFGREFVLDPVLLPLALAAKPRHALDAGCGEGRFCRMLASQGIRTTGIDPTAPLIAHARTRHPQGDYIRCGAESLPFPESTFDLVVSCLTLVDIEDYQSALREMIRVLRPGGKLLIANSNSFNTAMVGQKQESGIRIDRYYEERSEWYAWRGIHIRNFHRPLRAYMRVLLDAGLRLTFFDEPEPVEGAPLVKAASYRRLPWFLVMEWEKTGAYFEGAR